MRVLIVGGVAGGASAAARLRRLDENIEIIMFERDDHISYANCGLPYYIGGKITDKEALILQDPVNFKERFNIDVRISSEVTGIDRSLKTVKVKNLKTGEIYSEPYDKLIISTGAEPIKPRIKGMDSDRVFTLRNIPDTYKIKDFIDRHKPKSAAVVGGGYIGVEVAENLKKAGLDVILIEMAEQVIAPLDYEMACDLHRHIKRNGVKLLLKNAVGSIEDNGDNLSIMLEDSSMINSDMLIMAVGVKPNTSLAKSAGIDVDDKGSIIVSKNMLTSDPDIYAIGDAVAVNDFITGQNVFIPLAGPANKQGRIVADNICGINSIYEGTQGSAILKVFDMTVAVTGINEKAAEKLGLNYDKSYTYSASHASYYPGGTNMSIKIIFDKDNGKILGGQIVGYDGVDKRCDVLATAIRFGATAYDLTKLELCYAPPYSSAKDPINMAGYVVENILTGKVKNFHWHDINDLPRDGKVILLDVRTEPEFNSGSMDGFINIPLEELRERLSELDKSRKIYVVCQVGLRGYIACRILSQNGFDCYNLSGGYRLYRSIYKAETDESKEEADIRCYDCRNNKKNSSNGKLKY